MNLDNTYTLVSDEDQIDITLKDLFIKKPYTLLYFYPKDNTPGCSVENKDFTDLKKDFHDLNVQLIGVSKDSVTSHKNFIEKHDLRNPLISDPELILHKELGAYGEKNNYGKIVEGVIRSSFLIDDKGNIVYEWKNVRAKGHAQRILTQLSETL